MTSLSIAILASATGMICSVWWYYIGDDPTEAAFMFVLFGVSLALAVVAIISEAGNNDHTNS